MKKTDQRDFYSAEASSYEEKRYGDRYGRFFRRTQRGSVIRALSNLPRCEAILDVATGTGQMLPVLVDHADFVVASDLTPAMMQVASSQQPSDKIEYCVLSAFELPFADDTFDVVSSSRFLHLFEELTQKLLICEMCRVLKPGGALVIDFYSRESRAIFFPAIWLYRTLLRKRPENDHRVTCAAARRMVADAGLTTENIEGLGNFLLAPFLWLPKKSLDVIARFFGKTFPYLSEQFIVVATKK